MTPESLSEAAAPLVKGDGALIENLHARANASRWQLPRERFAEALQRSAIKHFGGRTVAAGELEAYLTSLALEDLALACACGDGNEAAWEYFVAHYRPELRAAARAILHTSGDPDGAGSNELADSLFAELYGLGPSGNTRQQSLFRYFHGRSKLSTWLRSILAQRHVDALRAGRRTVSLDADRQDATRPPEPSTAPPPADPDRERYLARFDAALTAAFAELCARDRLRLALFYLDQRTLAEIGRALGEHESTASRQLDRTRRGLRVHVTELLSRDAPATAEAASEPGLDATQIALAFEYALENWPFDLSRALSAGETGQSARKRGKGAGVQDSDAKPF